MACKFNIRLNPDNKGDNGWEDALRASALEIEALNAILVTNNLTPITVHPNADKIENYLGAVNTIPTESDDPRYAGIVTVAINEYDFIDHSLLPTLPTSFYFISGTPPNAGTIA